MNGVFDFLASRNGRITRAVIGVIILIIGLALGFQLDATFGWVLATYSIFLLLETALDLVLLAPFFGKSLSGTNIRSKTAVDDPLGELKKLQPALDEKSIALLNLMRFWLFGIAVIVSAAVYAFAYVFTLDDYTEAFNNTWYIMGAVAVICFLTYVGYWWYITRIRIKRVAAKAAAPQE